MLVHLEKERFHGSQQSLRHRNGSPLRMYNLRTSSRDARRVCLLTSMALWGERERKVIFGACGYREVAEVYKDITGKKQ